MLHCKRSDGVSIKGAAKNVRSCLESNNQAAVGFNIDVVTPFPVRLEPNCVEWDPWHQSNKETGDEKWHLVPPLKNGTLFPLSYLNN